MRSIERRESRRRLRRPEQIESSARSVSLDALHTYMYTHTHRGGKSLYINPLLLVHNSIVSMYMHVSVAMISPVYTVHSHHMRVYVCFRNCPKSTNS